MLWRIIDFLSRCFTLKSEGAGIIQSNSQHTPNYAMSHCRRLKSQLYRTWHLAVCCLSCCLLCTARSVAVPILLKYSQCPTAFYLFTFTLCLKIVWKSLELHLQLHVRGFSLTCGFFVSALFNSLNAELNPICHLLTLLGAHHILHISRIRVNIVDNS